MIYLDEAQRCNRLTLSEVLSQTIRYGTKCSKNFFRCPVTSAVQLLEYASVPHRHERNPIGIQERKLSAAVKFYKTLKTNLA